MKDKINSKNTTRLSTISLIALTSFIIFFAYLSEENESVVAQIQNFQGTNELVTTEQGQEGAAATENQKIVQQGVVTSTPDPLPGHEAHQSVTILRLKADNTIYDGTVSFIASKPVEVQLLYRNMNASGNAQTPPQIDPEFGTMSILPLPGGQGSVVSSLIQPPFPEGATSFSGSLPFAANGLALHNLDGEPFVATYTVVADQVGPPQRTDEIVNPTLIETTTDEDDDTDGNGGDDGDGNGDDGDGNGDDDDGDGNGDDDDGDGNGGDGGDDGDGNGGDEGGGN
jgi:hypothetical protein